MCGSVLQCVAVCCSVLQCVAQAPNVKCVDVRRSKADGAYAISSVNPLITFSNLRLTNSLFHYPQARSFTITTHYHDSRTRSTHLHDSRTCSTHHHDSRTHSFTTRSSHYVAVRCRMENKLTQMRLSRMRQERVQLLK